MIDAIQSGADQLAVGENFGIESSPYGGGIHGIFHGVCSCGLHTSLSAIVNSDTATAMDSGDFLETRPRLS